MLMAFYDVWQRVHVRRGAPRRPGVATRQPRRGKLQYTCERAAVAWSHGAPRGAVERLRAAYENADADGCSDAHPFHWAGFVYVGL